MSEYYETSYKIIVLGDGNVGKSSIIRRFISNDFDYHTPMTIGTLNYSHEAIIDKQKVNLSIWDTAGQEKYQSIVPGYFRGSQAAALLYDITDENSFKRVNYWINQAKELAKDDVCFILIGNKLDLESKRKVSRKQAETLAKAYNMLYFETSCLNAENVHLAFNELIKHLLQKNGTNNFRNTNKSFKVENLKGISVREAGDSVISKNSKKSKNKTCC